MGRRDEKKTRSEGEDQKKGKTRSKWEKDWDGEEPLPKGICQMQRKLIYTLKRERAPSESWWWWWWWWRLQKQRDEWNGRRMMVEGGMEWSRDDGDINNHQLTPSKSGGKEDTLSGLGFSGVSENTEERMKTGWGDEERRWAWEKLDWEAKGWSDRWTSGGVTDWIIPNSCLFHAWRKDIQFLIWWYWSEVRQIILMIIYFAIIWSNPDLCELSVRTKM